jgi:ABC-type transport system involved in cytochrome bd biosynthesis fused ATPase/permease subunit
MLRSLLPRSRAGLTSLLPLHLSSPPVPSAALLCARFSSSSGTIVSFRDVSFSHSETKPVLDRASFSVRAGAKVTVMGQNGSGKSTIINMITGKLQPDEGAVNVRARESVAVGAFDPDP